MGRYHPAKHDSFIKCETDRCGVKNAPDDSQEYDTECWRCGEPLDGKPQEGDELVVDIIDEGGDGTLVTKTEGGFVLFLDEKDVAAIQAKVRVVEVSDTSGQAEFIETV